MKAQILTIQIGSESIQGLELEDGTYRVALSQFFSYFQVATDKVLRDFKTLLGRDFQVSKLKTEIAPIAVNTISIEDFVIGAMMYSAKGNQKALGFIIATASESLERRFDAAAGKVRSEEERNRRADARMRGKVARRFLTDAIAEYITRHEKSDNYRKFIYSNCSDHLNKIILGAKAKQAKEFYQVAETSLLRNHIPVEALRELELTEEMAKRLIDERDMEPLEAVKQSCVLCFTKSIGM